MSNLFSIKAPERKERENEVMTVFEKIRAENIPEIMRGINPQI